MSDTLLLLDGDELDPLLARARELGGRVQRAERVRRGVGPFAKNRYEVTVEVADDAGGAGGAGPAATPRGGRPIGAAGAGAGAGTGAGAGGGARPGSALTTASPGGARGAGAAGLAALLAAAEAGDGVGEAVAAPSWAPVRPGSAEPGGEARATTPGRGASSAAPDAVAAAGQTAGADGGAGARSGGAARPRPAAAGGTAATAGARAAGVRPVAAHGSAVERLHDLGVPGRLLPTAARLGRDPLEALLALSARLPRPPRPMLRPGRVVAVVGGADEVLETAAQLLIRLREHPFKLVSVGAESALPGSDARLSSPRRSARLRADSADEVLLVLADTRSAGTERRLVENVLAALAPDQIWAALDARRSPGELAAQLAELPVPRVDAIAGQHTWRAHRPGDLLGLGPGVGWLDGLVATPVLWAALLQEALGRVDEPGPDR